MTRNSILTLQWFRLVSFLNQNKLTDVVRSKIADCLHVGFWHHAILMRCTEPNCNSNHEKSICEGGGVFPVFQFPGGENPDLHRRWIRFINRSDWEPSENSHICIKHFGESSSNGVAQLAASSSFEEVGPCSHYLSEEIRRNAVFTSHEWRNLRLPENRLPWEFSARMKFQVSLRNFPSNPSKILFQDLSGGISSETYWKSHRLLSCWISRIKYVPLIAGDD